MSELDRDVLKAQLRRWGQGELDERSVHGWAELIWDQGEWPEYPDKDPRSIAIEVLMQLDVLNQQLITPDDIPAMLNFLETPPGNELRGWERWRQYWDQLDMEERRRKVETNPYYSPGS